MIKEVPKGHTVCPEKQGVIKVMGKIYCIFGKTATGKDTIFRELLLRRPDLRTYVMYTTRPPREGEADGVAYHFTTEAALLQAEAAGRLIERRTYQTVHGPWTYATLDDGQIDLSAGDYLVPATLESYQSLVAYYGREQLQPIYIEADDGERLIRSVRREQRERVPKYREVCRRFLSDEDDFSEEKLAAAGIKKRYRNEALEACVAEILRDMDV